MQNTFNTTFNKDSYWFEKLTWWRLTAKTPCLSGVIEIKNDKVIIDEQDLYRLIMKINGLSYECDFEYAWIKNDPVQLQGKKLFKYQTKQVIFMSCLCV